MGKECYGEYVDHNKSLKVKCMMMMANEAP
jgi:hypothetical protein